MAKLNWDRVRMENLMSRRGTEGVGGFDRPSPRKKPATSKASKPSKASNKGRLQPRKPSTRCPHCAATLVAKVASGLPQRLERHLRRCPRAHDLPKPPASPEPRRPKAPAARKQPAPARTKPARRASGAGVFTTRCARCGVAFTAESLEKLDACQSAHQGECRKGPEWRAKQKAVAETRSELASGLRTLLARTSPRHGPTERQALLSLVATLLQAPPVRTNEALHEVRRIVDPRRDEIEEP